MWDGVATTITNLSGHYKATLEEAKNFGAILRKVGVNISNATLKVYNDGSKVPVLSEKIK